MPENTDPNAALSAGTPRPAEPRPPLIQLAIGLVAMGAGILLLLGVNWLPKLDIFSLHSLGPEVDWRKCLVVGLPWLVIAAVVKLVYRYGLAHTIRRARKTYLTNGWQPYGVATLILILLALLLNYAKAYSPSFMLHGWVSAISPDADSRNLLFPYLSGNSFYVRGLAVLLWALMLLAVPMMVRTEEMKYRRHKTGLRRIARASLIFGLMHVFSGIPLITALGLSVVGLLFASYYRFIVRLRGERVAFERVCCLHAAYNAIIFTIVYVAILGR